MNRPVILLIIVCAVALVGYFSLTGLIVEPEVSINVDNIIVSSAVWLETEEGRSQFPGGGVVDEIIPIYRENTNDVAYWYAPVKNNEGLILGAIIADEEEFNMPNSVMKFPEPRESLFLVTRDDAYTLMIQEHSEYSAGQISEPRLVAKSGLFWMSEVTANGEIIDELYVGTANF